MQESQEPKPSQSNLSPESASESTPVPSVSSRRDFIAGTGKIAAASVLAGISIPAVHAAGSDSIRLALIGSGGRGSGAVANAMAADDGVVLATMADLYEDRLERSRNALEGKFKERAQVASSNRFIGFDSFKKAIDTLRPNSGDIAMLTGYAGFRPQQLEYAVSKGVNVFMEKSFAVDPPGIRRVLKAAEEADARGVKVAAGVMSRHSRNREELLKRIAKGEIGSMESISAYRMGPSGPLRVKPDDKGDLEWQLRNFTKFFWVSGGLWSEMDIHQIDEICWIKGEYPVSAHGIGGRAFNNTDKGQNWDSYSVEWTFADGTKAYDYVRYTPKCFNNFATYIHGSEKAAQFSGNVHTGITRIFKDKRIAEDNILWEAPKEDAPYQAQWNDFIDAIQNDKPFNQAKRAAESNLAAIMGRAATHMGRVVTWDEALASDFQFNPNTDTLTPDSPAPITADENGQYPVPIPGEWVEL